MHAPSQTAKSPGIADVLIRLRALIALVVLVARLLGLSRPSF